MGFRHYAADVKLIVVRLRLQGEALTAINRKLGFDISVDSLRRWMALFKETRAIVADPNTYLSRGVGRIVNTDTREFLLELVEKAPDLYLDELQQQLSNLGTTASRTTISRELRIRLGLTLKVARTVHPAQDERARAAYIREVSVIPAEYLVFTDESALCADALQRRLAWAPKGQPTARLTRTRTSIRFSLLPTVDLTGMVASMVQEGSIIYLDFLYFLKYRLLPVMNPWPGPRSVLILDNTRIHHGEDVTRLCEMRGVLVRYLPAYSPDLNPIEKGFSVLKVNFRRTGELNGGPGNAPVIRDGAQAVFSAHLMAALFRVSGY